MNLPNRHLLPVLALLLAFVLGLLSVFSFAPFNAFWLVFFTWGGLFWLLETPALPSRDAALRGGFFGLGLFLGGCSWVYVSLHTYGGMPFLLAALLTLLFCAVLALYPALLALLHVTLRKRFALPPIAAALLFATLWGLMDWLRSWIFTGFPWLSLGYTQTHDSPLSGYLPLLGVFGVSLLTAWVAALLCSLRQSWFLFLFILLGGWALSKITWTTPEGPALQVALIQGNVAQNLKWQPEHTVNTLNAYKKQIETALDQPERPRLIVLPETAFPLLLHDLPTDYRNALLHDLRTHEADLLFGTVTQETSPSGKQHYRNSAVSLGVSPSQQYHKSHLVPFGEFIPTGFRWFLDWVKIPMVNLAPGSPEAPPLELQGQHLGINICYEDVFGESLRIPLPAAKILINLSNTAWFGDSLAQPQHLQMAQARAQELGRPVLRATNTGMTAVIDPDGVVRAQLPAFTQGTLYASVQGFSGQTPYARWGNTALLILSASFLLNLFWRKRP